MNKKFSFCFLLALFHVGALQADPIPDNTRILFLGPAAPTHGAALEALIDGDPTVNTRGITVDHHETDLLISAFYENAAKWQPGGVYTQPYTSNPLLVQLDEAYDVVVIHADRMLLLWPEIFMEAVRLVKRYAEPLGTKVLLVLPHYSSTQTMYAGNSTYEYPADNATLAKEQLYRIGDALDLEVVPAGLVWQELEQDPTINTPAIAYYSTSSSHIPQHYNPDLYAVNVYATTLYSALFEASAAQSTYRHGGISNAEFAAITSYANQTWQSALTATHYTGEHLGMLSPVIPTPAFPNILYDPAQKFKVRGNSTENFTSDEFVKIYERKGLTTAGKDSFGTSSADGPNTYEFVISRFSSIGTGDQVGVFQRYKTGIYQMVSGFTSGSATFDSILRRPNNKTNPNYMAFTRLWTEAPGFELGNVGDGHLNQNASMMMAAGVYAIVTGGEHPFLDGNVDLDEWNGPQRFAASIGYGTVMGAGRLAKLELPPVSVGEPRHVVARETATEVSLLGFDFDGIPLTVEILTPPQYGTLVANGSTPASLSSISGGIFTYTPQAGFDGLDSVTYRVSNGTATSQPLTVYLNVGPYVPETPSGAVFFEDNFDDGDVSDWVVDGNQEFSSAGSGVSWLGVPEPYDGTATLRLWNSSPAERVVDTTAFENLELTIRVGAGDGFDGLNRYGYTGDIIAHVEWYDGSNWHPLVSHVMNWVNYELLQTYQVSLPAAANDNDQFRLRLRSESTSGSATAAYFDGIQLSGDPIPRAPVASGVTLEVAAGVPVAVALEVSDENIYDSFTYSVNAPGNGSLSGTAPNLVYTPDPNFVGVDSFTFSVNDGTFDSNLATVTLNVRDNTAPKVSAGPDQVVSLIPTPFWRPSEMFPTAWYDASAAGGVVEDGGAVSSWNDLSNNDFHLTQGTETMRPSFNVGTLNGLNAISFDGADDVLSTLTNPFGSSIDDALVYVVYRREGNGYLFSLSGATGKSWTVEAPNFLNYVRLWVNGDGLTESYGVAQGDTVMTGLYGSTTDDLLQIFTNGSLLGEKAFTRSGQAVSGNIFLGSDSGTNFLETTIGELLIIGDTVTVENRQKIEGYLAHKWGLAAELPAEHPYKESPAGGPSATFDLNGVVIDDEGDPVVTTWEQVSGPQVLNLTSTSTEQTSADVLTPGTYVFRLSSDDGLEQSSDEVTIVIAEPIVDLDNDGVDDTWESTHFPGQEGSFNGSADSDGDGVTDFFEFLSDSNPHVPGSNRLGLSAGQSQAGGSSKRFQWTVKDQFVPGVHYQVLYSTDLSQGSWNPLPEEHRTLRPNLHDGMNTVEMEVTHDYGENLFIRLSQP